MKDKHQIDEIFKEALYGYEEEHPEHLWSGIAARINKKDKPNPMGPYLLWSSLALALLITGGVMFWFMNGNDGATEVNQANQTASLIQDNDESLRANEKNLAQESNTVNSGLTNSKKSTTDNTPTNPSTPAEGLENNQSQNNQIDQKTSSSAKSNYTENTNTSKNLNKQLAASHTSANAATHTKTITGSSISETQQRTSTPTVSNTDINTSSNLLANRQLLGSSESLTTQSVQTGGNEAYSMRNTVGSLAMLDLYPVRNISSLESLSMSSRIRKRQVDKSLFYGKNRIPVIWSVSVLASPDVVSRELTYAEDVDEAYFKHRSEKEIFVNAFTTAVRLEARMQAWTLTTGITYNQINERYTYMDDEATIPVGGVMKKGTLQKSKVNRYRFIEVPVLLGYRLRSGAFHMEFKGGVAISAGTRHSGEIFNDASLTNEVFSRKEGFNPFKDQAPLAVLGAISIGYKVGESMDLFVEPYYKFYTGSITKEDNTLKQSYKLSGLSLGVRQILR